MANALSPLTNKQLSKLARRYANAQFGPVLSQINKQYAQRAAAGASSIAQSTSALAAALAPQQAQTHQIYAQAQSAQDAVDKAIAAKLSGAGQSLGSDVSSQLAAAGQATAPGSALAGLGAGAGAASYGIGSQALSSLIGRGAAAENYSASLPGIARMGGAQRAQDLALQLEHGRQTDVQALQAKLPGTIADIEQSLGNRELQKAIAVQSGLVSGAKLQETAAYHSATIRARNHAISAANTRTGMTLAERANYHNRSLKQQAKHDLITQRQKKKDRQERARHNRQMEKNAGKKGSPGTPSWLTP